MMHKSNFMPAPDADSLIDLDWQLASSQLHSYTQTAASQAVALHETVASQALMIVAPSSAVVFSAGSLATAGSVFMLLAGAALALASRRAKPLSAI